jgi:hypothetical protein
VVDKRKKVIMQINTEMLQTPLGHKKLLVDSDIFLRPIRRTTGRIRHRSWLRKPSLLSAEGTSKEKESNEPREGDGALKKRA